MKATGKGLEIVLLFLLDQAGPASNKEIRDFFFFFCPKSGLHFPLVITFTG